MYIMDDSILNYTNGMQLSLFFTQGTTHLVSITVQLQPKSFPKNSKATLEKMRVRKFD